MTAQRTTRARGKDLPNSGSRIDRVYLLGVIVWAIGLAVAYLGLVPVLTPGDLAWIGISIAIVYAIDSRGRYGGE